MEYRSQLKGHAGTYSSIFGTADTTVYSYTHATNTAAHENGRECLQKCTAAAPLGTNKAESLYVAVITGSKMRQRSTKCSRGP